MAEDVTMVERVRAAIDDALSAHPGLEAVLTNTDASEVVVAAARAVIEAMREPTPAMLDIGEHYYLKAECGLLDTNVSALHNAWDVMIDEALSGRRQKWLSSPLPEVATTPQGRG
jgi:hypothetical protein